MRPSFTKDHLGEALELLRCPREASALVTAYVALASLHVSVRALEALVKQKVVSSRACWYHIYAFVA